MRFAHKPLGGGETIASMPEHFTKLFEDSRPATQEEIDEVLRESGVESLDEIPDGAIVTTVWEFLAELDCSVNGGNQR